MCLRIDNDRLILTLYFLSANMLAGQFLGLYSLTSISFTCSFFVVLFLWLFNLKNVTQWDILAMAIIGASFLGVIATCKRLTLRYFKNWLMFSVVFLYFSTCLKLKLKDKTVKRMSFLNTAVCLICLVVYVLRYDSIFYVTSNGVRYLTFYFYNPNSLALFLVCLLFSEMVYHSSVNENRHKIIYLCCIGVFSVLIRKTLSRTALLALLLFLFVYFFFKRRNTYFLPSGRLFPFAVAVFPFVFAWAYMVLINRISDHPFLEFLHIGGKSLDTRKNVWNYAIDLFQKSPFWGSYGEIATSASYSQMHNSYLHVLASYGVIVSVLMIVFLTTILYKTSAQSRHGRQELAVWAFIICLALGANEAILFSGGLSFYLYAGQFLILSNTNRSERP